MQKKTKTKLVFKKFTKQNLKNKLKSMLLYNSDTLFDMSLVHFLELIHAQSQSKAINRIKSDIKKH